MKLSDDRRSRDVVGLSAGFSGVGTLRVFSEFSAGPRAPHTSAPAHLKLAQPPQTMDFDGPEADGNSPKHESASPRFPPSGAEAT